MKNDILASLTSLPDAQLVAQVKSLIFREREVTAELIAHLAELDTRDVHLREGYPSLYVYCRDALGLSEWEAYNRIEVARVARRFPVILEMLAEGWVNLTTVKLLAPHLTPVNHLEVLESARGKRKAEVEEIVARLSPRPDVPASVRRLPARRSELGAAGDALILDGAAAPSSRPLADYATEANPSPAPVPSAASPSPNPAPMKSPSPPVTPLAPDRYKLQLTISGETLQKLRLAQDMLGHTFPSGDEAAVVDRALTDLLVNLAKTKFADTPGPRGSKGRQPGARTPAAAVKRAVWVRDLGRCAFVGKSGHRCGERRFVEFHHVDAYALGGEATVDGIQLRCRRHNDYEGRLYFGRRRRPRCERIGERVGGELVLEQVRLSPSGSTS
jgi:hypothetical protein